MPLWIPGFAGSFIYGDVNIEGEDGVNPEQPIEPPPGGIFGKILSRLFTEDWYLKFFFMTKIVYEKNNFLAQLDALSGAVGHANKFNYNNTQIVHSRFRSTNLRLFGGYKLVHIVSKNEKFQCKLYGYVGTRLYFQNVYSELDGAGVKLNIHPFWAEPIFGLQNRFLLKKWLLILQGDYGGLFINTKYSVQITGNIYYRIGKISSIKLGWNHLKVIHASVFHEKDYKAKVILSGPSVGVTFHF